MEMLEALLEGVRSACAAFPDQRRGEVPYSMADIGLSAFSLFFMQSESFLAHQRALQEGRKTSNCQSLFGMTAVPTDKHIRAMLDPVHPSHLQPAFDQTLDMLRRHGWTARLPAAQRPCADRARRHGVLLLAKARLSAVPDAPAG